MASKVTEAIKADFNQKILLSVASVLICWTTLSCPQSVKAAEGYTVADVDLTARDSSFVGNARADSPINERGADVEPLSALTAFADQIDHDEQMPASAKALDYEGKPFEDEAYLALKDFAGRLGNIQRASTKHQMKYAESDNALDALREFLNKGTSPQQSTPSISTDGPIAGGKRSSSPVEATFVGKKVCLTCHTTQAESFGKTLMGRIGKTQQGKFDCENCHGPGSAHVKAGGGRGVGGIISFRPEDQARTAEENNAVCLNCHEKGDRTYWNGSTHETRGLMCTNCHTIMKEVSRKNQLKTAVEPDTCFQCHKDRRAQMARSSHMPLREGKIVCSDCHNPHGSATDGLLRAASINDTCYKCHAEKRGPFLFEHLPVRENCLNCHDPHGSVNESMLKISRPRLCVECHTFGHGTTSGPLAVQTISRQCQNCHTEVHGTNSPSGPLLHR